MHRDFNVCYTSSDVILRLGGRESGVVESKLFVFYFIITSNNKEWEIERGKVYAF